jgi:hypothetical protein
VSVHQSEQALHVTLDTEQPFTARQRHVAVKSLIQLVIA